MYLPLSTHPIQRQRYVYKMQDKKKSSRIRNFMETNRKMRCKDKFYENNTHARASEQTPTTNGIRRRRTKILVKMENEMITTRKEIKYGYEFWRPRHRWKMDSPEIMYVLRWTKRGGRRRKHFNSRRKRKKWYNKRSKMCSLSRSVGFFPPEIVVVVAVSTRNILVFLKSKCLASSIKQ